MWMKEKVGRLYIKIMLLKYSMPTNRKFCGKFIFE